MIYDEHFTVFVKDMNQPSLGSDLNLQNTSTFETLDISLCEGVALLATCIEGSEHYLSEVGLTIRLVLIVGDSQCLITASTGRWHCETVKLHLELDTLSAEQNQLILPDLLNLECFFSFACLIRENLEKSELRLQMASIQRVFIVDETVSA